MKTSQIKKILFLVENGVSLEKVLNDFKIKENYLLSCLTPKQKLELEYAIALNSGFEDEPLYD